VWVWVVDLAIPEKDEMAVYSDGALFSSLDFVNLSDDSPLRPPFELREAFKLF